MEQIKDFEGRFVLCAPSSINDVCNLTQCGLIYIKEIHEMTSHAGYFVRFMHIAGEYDIIVDIKSTDNGNYGILPYSQAVRLLDRSQHPIEKFLNEKNNS